MKLVGPYQLYLMMPLLLVLAVADYLYGGTSGIMNAQNKQQTQSAESTQCIGRFKFSMLAGFTTGRSQTIYTVDVRTVSIAFSSPQIIWNDELEQIAAIKAPEGVSSSIIKTFELQPGVPAVWYYRQSSSTDLIALKAMKPFQGRVLIVSRGADLRARPDLDEQRKKSIVEQLVKNVVDAYTTQTDYGFCVGYGTITSEPSINGLTLISFTHPQLPGFDLRFETRTVSEPDNETYSSLHEERAWLAGTQAKLTVLKDSQQTVAGMEGKEIRISVTLPEEPSFVRFTWHFPGVSRKSDRPAIDILATANIKNQKRLEEVWEKMLQSLQSIPMSK